MCDVGGIYDPKRKLFDHHQVEYQGSLSSAGMILAYLRDQQIIKLEEFELFNNSMIRGVDDHDNGRAPQDPGYCKLFSMWWQILILYHMRRMKTQNEAFTEALHFVYGHLKRLWDRYHYNLNCKEIVAEKMQRYRTLDL